MDRAADSGSVGRGFKSLRARFIIMTACLFLAGRSEKIDYVDSLKGL